MNNRKTHQRKKHLCCQNLPRPFLGGSGEVPVLPLSACRLNSLPPTPLPPSDTLPAAPPTYTASVTCWPMPTLFG